MSGFLPAAVVLVGAAVVAYQLHHYAPDPLEPTITCTPEEEGK
ncbi:hypothetical protein [Streptosporangium sp. G12]